MGVHDVQKEYMRKEKVADKTDHLFIDGLYLLRVGRRSINMEKKGGCLVFFLEFWV